MIGTRRLVGIASFVFLALHFRLTFHNNFNLDFFLIFADIKYLIALPALFIFIALAITSANYALKKMGFAKWKAVQRTAYLAFVLSLPHFYGTANGLFIRAGQKTFVNLAEIALLLLAAMAIILQLAGFFARKRKNSCVDKKIV